MPHKKGYFKRVIPKFTITIIFLALLLSVVIPTIPVFAADTPSYFVTGQVFIVNGAHITVAEAGRIATAGNTVLNITDDGSHGTFTLWMANGTSGTITSGTSTITPSTTTLASGLNTITATGTGTATLNLTLGTGANWDTVNSWAASSGGQCGAAVPTTTNSAYFDSKSFTDAGQTCTVDATANCLNMDWTGAANNPILAFTNQVLNTYGNVTFIAAMSTTRTTTTGSINFSGSGNHILITNTLVLGNTISTNTPGFGTLTLGDNLSLTGYLSHRSGVIDTMGYSITQTSATTGFSISGSELKTLTLSSSVISCVAWNYSGSGLTLTSPNTSTINVSGTGAFAGGGITTYNILNLNGTAHTISGSNTFNTLALPSGTTQTITFTDGTTQTITTPSLSGSAGHIHTLRGSGVAGWNITKTDSTAFEQNYVSVSYSTASPASTFYAGVGSTNGGNNNGWIFTPLISTSAATSVLGTSTTLNGVVTFTGLENPTITLYWGISDGGTDPTAWSNNGSPTSPSQPQGAAIFYKNLTGLLPNTTYYFTAKATNSAGTAWGTTLNFYTAASAPTVTTLSAVNISMDKFGVTTGSFSGNLTGLDTMPSADCWFDFGTTDLYGSSTTNITYSSTGNIQVFIPASLTLGQTYHFRFNASNGAGTTHGSDMTFTLTMPSITTLAASSIAMDKDGVTSGYFRGQITNMGVSSSCYFKVEYGILGSFTANTSSVSEIIAGIYQITIPNNLIPGASYQFRIILTVGAIDAIGNTLTFNLTMPSITTESASNLSVTKDGVTSGYFNGEVTAMGNATDAYIYVEYGTSPLYGDNTSSVIIGAVGFYSIGMPNNGTTNVSYVSFGGLPINISGNITGSFSMPANFIPGVTYHYRVDIRIGAVIVNGLDETLVFDMPTIQTNSATSITMTTLTHATLNGYISNMGSASSSYIFWQWGYDTGYGNIVGDASIVGIGNQLYNLTHFNPDYAVHYRFVLYNGSTFVYGSDETFSIVGSAAGGSAPYAQHGLNEVALILFCALGIFAMFQCMIDGQGFMALIIGAVLVYIITANVNGINSLINSLY